MTAYDPILKNFSHIRHARYMLTGSSTPDEFMQQITPEANIVKIFSHDPIVPPSLHMDIYELATRQRVFVDGVPYIDGFGYHVYVSCFVDLSGKLADMDERGVPELETFKPYRYAQR